MAATDSRGENVRVAVLGTGIMGSAMARNLVAAGLRTTVWDRSPTATAPLVRRGSAVAASPAEAVRDAQVVITMLPTAEVVNSVIFDGGVADASPRRGVGSDGHDRRRSDTAIAEPARSAAARRHVRGRAGVGQQGPGREPDQLLILASGPPAAAAGTWRPAFSAFRPQDRVAGPSGPGQPDEAGRQRLHVHPHRGRGRDHGAGWPDGHRSPPSSPRPSRAARWTRRSPTPSSTRSTEAISPEFPLEWALKDVDLAISAAGGDHAAAAGRAVPPVARRRGRRTRPPGRQRRPAGPGRPYSARPPSTFFFPAATPG